MGFEKRAVCLLGLFVLVFCVAAGCGRQQVSEERFIEVNGVTLAYLEAGSGKPLILLHGGGGNNRDFEPVMEELSQDYKVYAIDSRGHGNSSAVEEYNYQDMANDMKAFIKAKKLDHPVLYGFSDGGITGLLLASQDPDLLSELIISGANASPDGLRSEDRKAMEREYRLSGDPLLKMELTQPHLTESDLHRISIPTLVLAGSRDMIKEPHTRFLATNIPDSRLEILEGESHSSYVMEGTKLARIIKDFLNE